MLILRRARRLAEVGRLYLRVAEEKGSGMRSGYQDAFRYLNLGVDHNECDANAFLVQMVGGRLPSLRDNVGFDTVARLTPCTGGSQV